MGNDEKIITPGQGLIRLLLIIFRISSFTNRWNKYLKLKIEIGSLFMLGLRQQDLISIVYWMKVSPVSNVQSQSPPPPTASIK